MNLRHDVMPGDTVLNDVDVDTAILDEELLADELAGIVELTAAFLAWAEVPLLRWDLARFSFGTYTLEELAADLGRLGAWIRGNA